MTTQSEFIFSNWAPWDKRKELSRIERPGVYVLAHFKKSPSGNADPLSKEVIYIGETCNTLKERWQQFERATLSEKSSHSGGTTYRKLFKGKKRNLCVAAFPVDRVNQKHVPLFIRFVERKLIYDFAVRWKIAPKCNKK